jgi:hypothetical protein
MVNVDRWGPKEEAPAEGEAGASGSFCGASCGGPAWGLRRTSATSLRLAGSEADGTWRDREFWCHKKILGTLEIGFSIRLILARVNF